MVTRRFAVALSDEEDDDVPVRMKRSRRRRDGNDGGEKREKKKVKIVEEEDDDYEEEEEEEEEDEEEEDPEEEEEVEKEEKKKKERGGSEKRKKKKRRENEDEEDEEEGSGVLEDAKPIGEVIKVSGKGRGRKKHYQAFEYDGNRYDLETPVLLVPEDSVQKPYVAIIKNLSSMVWPDSYVVVVASLEQASHDSLYSDFQKYNQKMRQLVFNLKNNALLARRFICGDLEPAKILSMLPNELKEGLTAEELAKREPEEKQQMQMTDARCRRCTEKKVGLLEIIQSGLGDRYQLECIACGNQWYASRDEVATLTIDGPNTTKNVGTAPLATAKFEDVEKKIVKDTSTDTPKNPPSQSKSDNPSSNQHPAP